MTYSLRSGADRYAKWEKRFQPESQSCSPIMARLMDTATMPARVAAIFDDLVLMEEGVRAILDAQSVPTILAGQYLNYARQLWKLKGRYPGAAGNLEANSVLALWVARGLTLSTLEAVRDYFGYTAPV